MKKLIFLLICTFLATSMVFAQERQRRGGKQQEEKPPVTQQQPEKMTPPSEKKLDPRIIQSLQEMKIPENFEVIYTSQNFKFQKLNSEAKWKIAGTINQIPGDTIYGSYFNLIIYLPFDTQREFNYDGKNVKMTDSDIVGGNFSGPVTDLAVRKKFQEEFDLLSYHLTGNFLLNPHRVIAHVQRIHAEADYIDSAGIIGIIFRIPPSPGNEPQELHLTLEAKSMNLLRLDRIYFLREEKFQDTWELFPKGK